MYWQPLLVRGEGGSLESRAWFLSPGFRGSVVPTFDAPNCQCDCLREVIRTTSTRHAFGSACSTRQDGRPQGACAGGRPGFSTLGRSRWSPGTHRVSTSVLAMAVMRRLRSISTGTLPNHSPGRSMCRSTASGVAEPGKVARNAAGFRLPLDGGNRPGRCRAAAGSGREPLCRTLGSGATAAGGCDRAQQGGLAQPRTAAGNPRPDRPPPFASGVDRNHPGVSKQSDC